MPGVEVGVENLLPNCSSPALNFTAVNAASLGMISRTPLESCCETIGDIRWILMEALAMFFVTKSLQKFYQSPTEVYKSSTQSPPKVHQSTPNITKSAVQWTRTDAFRTTNTVREQFFHTYPTPSILEQDLNRSQNS